MAINTQSEEQLKQTKKKLRIVLITIAGIWIFLLVSYLVFVLFYAKEGSFRVITAVPFFIGPITILPLYRSYKRVAQELDKRK